MAFKGEDVGIKLGVYSIYDKKAQAYFNPIYYHYKGEALRWFEDVVQDEKSNLSRHPADFAFFRVGMFNVSTGALESCAQPEFVAEALDFRPVKKE